MARAQRPSGIAGKLNIPACHGSTFAAGFLLAGAPRFLAMALFGTLAPVVAIVFIGGLGAGGINPILGAVEYERVLRQLQARVLGALNASAWAGIPVGSLAAGPAVSSLGLRTALLSAAVIYAMATLPPFFFPVWRQMDSVSRATPPHPSPERQEALPHDQGQTIGHKL